MDPASSSLCREQKRIRPELPLGSGYSGFRNKLIFLLKFTHDYQSLKKSLYPYSLNFSFKRRAGGESSVRLRANGTRREVRMSTAPIEIPQSESQHSRLVKCTIEACHLAKEAAGAAAEGIATGSMPLLSSLRQREKELDNLDREIDAG